VLPSADARWVISVIDEDDNVLNTVNAFGDSVAVTVVGMANTSLFIAWELSDGCDNIGRDTTEVIFVDIVDPTPLCITTLSIATMDTDGTAVIWASDYDQGSFDNCSDVKFFFLNDEGIASPSYTFTCDDIPNGISVQKDVELFVSDEAGNISSCNVTITVSDNVNVCPDGDVESGAISGLVLTDEGDPIEGASVLISTGATDLSAANGEYTFENVPVGPTYTITAARDNDDLNGVSTLDLVLIQRHILALTRFDNQPDMIAADVNADGRITALDLVHIRRLILGFTAEFEDNTSWKFFDPNQNFDGTSSTGLVESLVITNFAGVMTNQDILGIKIGDVSGNAVSSSLQSTIRSDRRTALVTNDRLVEAGKTIEVVFKAEGIEDLLGLQMALSTTDAEILEISGLDIDESYTRKIDDQHMALAWWTPEVQDYSSEITVTIRAEQDGWISEMLSLDQEILESALYDGNYAEYAIDLQFNKNNAVLAENTLYQNTPNPFSETTAIGFDLQTAGPVSLTVYDMSGRTVMTRSLEGSVGYNEIRLTSADIEEKGVLLYELKTAGYTATKKMIVIP